MKLIKYLLLIGIISSVSITAQVTDFQRGLEAFNAKNYEKAFKHLEKYARDSNDCVSQYIVGFCYADTSLAFANDSLADYYLLQASEQKYGRAMGMLAVRYFEKQSYDKHWTIMAYVWAELAANYDPIQSLNSHRATIKAILEDCEIDKANEIIAEKKKLLDQLENCM
ncbi:MAG: hypothetical protein RIF34_00545 [Candidatus Kapaibacterium sp.]